jgi:hypothetical protein
MTNKDVLVARLVVVRARIALARAESKLLAMQIKLEEKPQ